METLIDRIRKHEGFRKRPYLDSQNVWTVGWGHQLSDPSEAPKTVDELEILFIEDLYEATRTALGFVHQSPTEVPSEIFSVIVEMAFNLGYYRLSQFKKFQKALFQSDYKEAARQMLDSLWAEQVGQRAVRLAKIVGGV